MDLGLFAILLVVVLAAILLLIWFIVLMPQNRARKTQERVVSELKVGEQIVTVGGLIGKLTYLNRDEDVARIEIASGVEVKIIPAAISHPFDYMDRLRAAERAGSARESSTSKPAAQSNPQPSAQSDKK